MGFPVFSPAGMLTPSCILRGFRQQPECCWGISQLVFLEGVCWNRELIYKTIEPQQQISNKWIERCVSFDWTMRFFWLNGAFLFCRFLTRISNRWRRRACPLHSQTGIDLRKTIKSPTHMDCSGGGTIALTIGIILYFACAPVSLFYSISMQYPTCLFNFLGQWMYLGHYQLSQHVSGQYMYVGHLSCLWLFSCHSMTGVGGRPEVIVEGSNKIEGPWEELNFLYKPGDVSRRPPIVGENIFCVSW